MRAKSDSHEATWMGRCAWRTVPLSVATLPWVLAMVTAACSGSSSPMPTTPTTPATPTTPTLSPPVIQSIAASSPRIEAGGQIQVTAKATASGTGDQLTYQWAASPTDGGFSGSGEAVTWTAPSGQPTPALFTLTLTAVESAVQNGKTTQSSASSSTQVHYNDSTLEITGLSTQFLKDFTTFAVTPAQCVRNFSDSCPGKAAELSDITNNRQLFHILSGSYFVQSISYNGSHTFANVVAPCTFFDIPNSTGREERVDGICTLTATYENWQWYLCDSHFKGTGTTPLGSMAEVLGRRAGR